MPQNLLATMFTVTTYGTWLPGDLRGYVENGITLPPNPPLEIHARRLMKGDPVLFSPAERDAVFGALIDACDEYHYTLIRVSIESWHGHWLLNHGFSPVKTVAGRLKNALRKELDRGRIWTVGYDKRFCFTEAELQARIDYITRHAGYRPLPASHVPFGLEI